MDSSAPPREYDATMAAARGRLAALARAREDLAGLRDDDRGAQRRAQLFDDLVEEFDRQRETTFSAEVSPARALHADRTA